MKIIKLKLVTVYFDSFYLFSTPIQINFPKENYVFPPNLFAQFDGKIRKSWGEKFDYVALCVIGVAMEKEKVLGDMPIDRGTGENMAQSVNTLFHEWGIADRIIGVAGDTTSSNTGCDIGKIKLILYHYRIRRTGNINISQR
jgi:hypothetical protein